MQQSRHDRKAIALLLLAVCLVGYGAVIGAVTVINLATQVTGTLGVGNGGTGGTSAGTNGQVLISNGSTFAPGDPYITANTPKVVHSATNNVGGATVKTLTTTITSTTAGNSLIVAVCAGEVVGANIVLTVSDTNSDTVTGPDATQAVSTTFACSMYHFSNITAANTGVTATFSGSSSANTTIAMEVWEVSGLINVASAVLEQTAIGTATSTTLLAGQILPNENNDYAFAAFGVGTAAQTITLTGTGTWSNDSGQVNPASASGLFSFVGASQWLGDRSMLSAGGTITSEPWVAVLAVYQPVSLPVQQMPIGPVSASNYTTPVCTAAMTGTTSTVTMAAPAAGLHNYVTSIIVTNSHATVGTFVLVQDGSGGTTLWEGYAAATGLGWAISFPNGGLRQPTAGNGLYFQDVTTGANVIACATGYTGP